MNICEHLAATARILPNQTALRFEGASFSYAELDGLSVVAAKELQAAGINEGDRIAVILGNVPAFAVWYYAALRVGAIVVSISTRAAPSESRLLIDDCQAKLVVANDSTLLSLASDMPPCVVGTIATSDNAAHCAELLHQLVSRNSPSPTAEFRDETGPEPGGSESERVVRLDSDWIDADPHDPAVILYTSGTTGFAKGATLSHRNVRSNVAAFNHLCDMQSSDRILLAVPLFHCFGQNALLNSALNVGATLILQRGFDLSETKRLIADEQITQLYGVPMMFQLLLNSCEVDDLASVRYCFSAAATLPIQVSEQWQDRFEMPIHEGYGLTETSPFASYNHRVQFVTGSIGTPIDSVEMRVVDTETGDRCPPGTLGEIVIRGPNVMLGYWNRDDETNAAIRDGWFHSGDIGRVDERGFFYIVDRVKDMISVGGLKVFPAEVERVLLDHPAVEQVAVVGVPDAVFGESVVAFVVLSEEDGGVAAIKAYAEANLAHYKVPRVVTPIEELPRNASGKILKRQLRTMEIHDVEGGQTTSIGLERLDEAPICKLRSDLEETHAGDKRRVANSYVQQLVEKVCPSDNAPKPTDRFLDLGLDSLMIVDLSNHLRADLPETDIPVTLVFDHPRLCDLADYLIAVLVPEAGGETAIDEDASPELASHDIRSDIESMTEEQALEALMRELKDG